MGCGGTVVGDLGCVYYGMFVCTYPKVVVMVVMVDGIVYADGNTV